MTDQGTHVVGEDRPLLEVRELEVTYPGRGLRPTPVRVLQGVSLDIRRGETVGLVGESGSGKSTLGRAILGLAPVTGGSINFGGADITRLRRRQRRALAQHVQVVFQDPYSSLNPAMTIEDILTEPLHAGGRRGGTEAVRALLDQVHLPAGSGRRLAREFSGGQRQRIAIARALCLEPELIVCDEPTSALDLSTQRRVLDLLVEIQERTAVAYLFITHDLAVVRAVSHRVAVMLDGELVEVGTAEEVATRARHPYTRRLQLAVPVADPEQQRLRRESRRELLADAGGA